jgi:hypothetical protein
MSSSIVDSARPRITDAAGAVGDEPTDSPGQPIGNSEASMLPRVVTVLTPFFAIAAGWLASWIGKSTGVVVDQGQLTVLMSLAATAALAAAWKWMQGWQQHERLVALGRDVPRRAGKPAAGHPSDA